MTLALVNSVLATALFAPPVGADVVYLKHWWQPPTSIWVAHNDGGSPRQVVKVGYRWVIVFARLSPNGRMIDYYLADVRVNGGSRAMVVPAAGGKLRMVARNVRVLIWSPDSSKIAGVLDNGSGAQHLVLIDVRTGTMRELVVASQIQDLSFAPNAKYLAYAAGRVPRFGSTLTDVYTISVNGGKPRRLTADQHCFGPVWGPQSIVFSRWRPDGRGDIKSESLYLVRPTGKQLDQLTHAFPSIEAVGWSASGGRLLVNVQAAAAIVNPSSGKVQVVGGPTPGNAQRRIPAYALSKAGTTILGTIHVSDAPDGLDVVTLPFNGGTPRTLVPRASGPSWDR